jgi:hypothetical protein
VLGFSAREAAAALQTTVPSVNSALKRARRQVRERLPEQSRQQALGDERLQPAVGCFVWDPALGAYVAAVLDVLSIRGERISAVIAFVDGDAFERFGLPRRIPG